MILQYCCSGFPHSDICVSMDICSSTQLFAACHVLLRLLMPRHSSYALIRLTSSEKSQIFRKRFLQTCFLGIVKLILEQSSFSLSSLRFYVSKFCSVISFLRYLVQLSQHLLLPFFYLKKPFSYSFFLFSFQTTSPIYFISEFFRLMPEKFTV